MISFVDQGAGAPVVLFHGAPGSRRFVPGPVDGIRLVTFDRPGYGDADSQPGRTVLDTAHQVVALADQLHIDTFAVIGWSGGGPFACATAFAYPERVTRCAIVSAPGPLDEVPNGWELLGDYQRPTAEMARVDPARSERAIARHMTDYIAHPSSFLGSGNGPDGAILRGSPRPMLDEQIALALKQGATGIAQDLVAMWVDWQFSLTAVRTPTRVWHGARDPHNDEATQAYAQLIPGAARVVWAESGHLGIIEHWAEVRDWAAGGNR